MAFFLKQVISVMNLCLKFSQIMLENQVNRSQLCVAFPHLPQLGEGVLQLVVSKPRFRRF